MNILFVLYGDLASNTSNPIILIAEQLCKFGHKCVITISKRHCSEAYNNQCISVLSHDEVFEKNALIFSGGTQRADVIHCCTPRVIVSKFISKYQLNWPSPLLINLEDNEGYLASEFLEYKSGQKLEHTRKELEILIPETLSNPLNYRDFISLADYVVLLQDKLSQDAPIHIPSESIAWGVNLDFFNPEVDSNITRDAFGISNQDRVIVYHGGLNGFNYRAMLDLCKAIELINDRGYSCFLIRTGPNKLNFLDQLNQATLSKIIELGVVERDQLPKILKLADLFVQPGRIDDYENLRLPSKLAEFMAMGKPVLLPNVNIAEKLDDGVNVCILRVGEPVEIANECIKFFENPDLMKSIGKKGREFAESNFDIKVQAMLFLEAYKKTQSHFEKSLTRKVWSLVASSGFRDANLFKMKSILSKNFQEENEVGINLLKGVANELMHCYAHESNRKLSIEIRLDNSLAVDSGGNLGARTGFVPYKFLIKLFEKIQKILKYLKMTLND